MVESSRIPRHLYRLILSDDGAGPAQNIEFEAGSAELAIIIAERHGGGREAQLFEDGRLLGVLQSRAKGFWILSAGRVGLGQA